MGSTRDQVTAWNAGWKEYKESSFGLPYGDDHFDDELPQLTVYLDDFEIDQYEASVAQYRRCVAAGICEPPEPEYTPYFFNDAAFDDYPVVGVLWGDAQTYCAWVGKRLPTEAEWEKAARGTDGRRYPWGDNWDKEQAALDIFTSEVGTYPGDISPYGALDTLGNVQEWIADWYAPDYYVHSPDRNPQGPESGEEKMVRPLWGRGTVYGLTCRDYYFASGSHAHLGFRCVYAP
jgi:formylglycine-generating enzyme required for sulfatase activity